MNNSCDVMVNKEMTEQYLPVIGLEVHAELLTRTKMFCCCRVVDTTQEKANSSVCPVCAGMPGSLPVINREAVRHALRVALALNCDIAPFSLFARKNYFYPDLPKGYQISQYEYPLATGGNLPINTVKGKEIIHLQRVHLEEDTGKLTHITNKKERYSLVDLNRAGVALLEIVTEPELFSLDSVKTYSTGLRAVLKYLKASSGDMEKGAMRFEANVSMRKIDNPELGTRVEIKNLNSFRAMEKAIKYEIERQTDILSAGGFVEQETVGWSESGDHTVSQRSKEEAHDYRYFPEPDLPPLTIETAWVEKIRAELPELPHAKTNRFMGEYHIGEYLANLLCNEPEVADFFEKSVKCNAAISPRVIANWITGDIFAYLNQNESIVSNIQITPTGFTYIIEQVENGSISRINGKQVLNEALLSGKSPEQIIRDKQYMRMVNEEELRTLVADLLSHSSLETESYQAGKTSLLEWFVGQAMKKSHGKADPNQLRTIIQTVLKNNGD